MIFVVTWQGFHILLPLVHIFLSVVQPWRPPWALHGICLAARRVCMPIGLYFIYQQPCLEQCLIFWLPFMVTFPFLQPLHALMPVSLSSAREEAAGQESSKDVLALSTSYSGTHVVQALQGDLWGAAYEQFSSSRTMSPVSSSGPAGFDRFGLSKLTAT